MSNTDQLLKEAAALHKAGNFAEAEQKYKQVLKIDSANFMALHLFGLLAKDCGNNEVAKEFMSYSVRLQPEYHHVYFDYAMLLKEDSQYDQDIYNQCLRLLKQTIMLKPDHMEAYLELSNLFQEQSRVPESKYCLEKLNKNKKNELSLHNLAGVYRNLGDKARATEMYQEAFKMNYHLPATHAGLIKMGVHPAFEDEKERQKLLDYWQEFYDEVQTMTPQEMIDNKVKNRFIYNFNVLSSALFELFDKMGDIDKAFYYLDIGYKYYRQSYVYASYQYEMETKSLKEIFNKDFVRSVQAKNLGNKSKSPIFILGMPRSGSTLTEQILGSHSSVIPLGEMFHLKQVTLGPKPSKRASDFGVNVTTFSDEEFTKRGDMYVEYMRQHITKDYPVSIGVMDRPDLDRPLEDYRFVDKMPANFLLLGYIKLLLPNAKIIYTKREKMDNCWSTFKHSFSAAQHFSYNFQETLEYYDMCSDMMDYWMDLFPGEIFTMEYEKLVEDQESYSRKILDYCDLEWEDACLDFHKNKRAVRTASEDQVRKPMYKSAIGSWRKYEKFLGKYVD